jgi:SAM-dependent methyltransferase
MNCCLPHNRAAARLFSRFSGRYRRRYRRKGLERLQRLLVEGLGRAGFTQATLLEIGCGVGFLHQSLIEAGATSAVGVDLSEGMLEQARAAARERGLEGRVTYLQGDFLELAAGIEPADVVLLDKVICCYPDAEGLVRASQAKARRVYAFTIPRDRWWARAGGVLTNLALRLLGSSFRAYVHDPVRIDGWLAGAGFQLRHQANTLNWLARVYVRTDA